MGIHLGSLELSTFQIFWQPISDSWRQQIIPLFDFNPWFVLTREKSYLWICFIFVSGGNMRISLHVFQADSIGISNQVCKFLF